MDAEKRALMILLLPLVAGVALAQESVGRIISIDGIAEIDAFGNAAFIQAREGDRLYERTVIKTDVETWVSIEVGGTTYEIAALSETRVSSFVAGRRRAAGDGFLRRLIGGLGRALAPPPETEQRFGTDRASEAVQNDGFAGFVLDVDVDAEYELAVASLEAGEFREAMEHFALIEFPEDGSFDLEEFYVDKTWALMGMGDLSEAIRTALAYADPFDPSVDDVNQIGPRLQLLVAVAAWYTDDDVLAREAAVAHVDDLGVEAADAQAITIAILSQRETDRESADRLERQAREGRPAEAWDTLLSE